jgi:uncharacterized protein (TIRG00374 family)
MQGAPEESSGSQQLFGKRLGRRLLAPIMVAIAAYVLLLLYGDAPQVLKSLQHLPPSAGVLGVSIAIASLAIRGLRWHLYLVATKLSVPILDSALIFGSGLGMSITPGKVGELLKSLLLKESHDVPIARSAPIIVAERLMDLVTLVLLGAVSLGAKHHPLASLAAGAAVLVAFLAFGRSEKLGSFAIGIACLAPFLRRHREKLLEAHASLRELWGFASFSIALVLSFASWGLQALTVSVFAQAVGGVQLSAPDAFISYAAPLLAGTLALIPGGLGLTEASMTGTLQAVSGISASASVAVTILTRAATFWVAVLLGFAALGLWHALRRPAAVGARS